MIRRITALLVCLCMMIICAPAAGIAEALVVEETEEIVVPEPESGLEDEAEPEEEPEITAEPGEESEAIVVEEVFIEQSEPDADDAQNAPEQESPVSAPEMSDAQAAAGTGEKGALYQYTNLSLRGSMLSTTVMREFDERNLPQSAHDYAADEDTVYHYAADKAAAIRLTFDSKTFFEAGFDGLVFYDADGNYIEHKTGSELAGITYTVPGNALYMRMVSDASVQNWGFAVTSMECVDQTQITSLYSDGNGGVTIKWKNYSGINGYQLQRAAVDASTGKAGKYTTLAQGTGKSQYKDTTAKANTLYSYRVRIYAMANGGISYAKFAEQKIYNFKTTAITGTGAVSGSTEAAIRLKWNAVSGAKYYEILRSASASGAYSVIGTATGTSYTDYPPEKSTYYYKVKPYVSYKGAVYTTYASAAKALGYPKAPSGIFARGSAAKTVTLTWSKTPNVKGYILYRSTKETSGYKKVTSLTGNKYTDTNAFVRRVNYYKLRTYMVIGGQTVYSDYSDPVAVYPLAKPAGVTGKKLSKTSVRVSWNAVPNAQDYVIYRSYASGGTYEEIGATTGTSFTATGLTESYENVYLRVYARRTDGTITSMSNASATVKVQKNPKTLRALYVINQNFPDPEDLLPNVYQNDTATLGRIMSKATPENLKLTTKSAYKNQGRTQLLQRIARMAELADANDTTFFYLITHGAKPYADGTYWIYLSDGQWITGAELAAALKAIPGRVIVVLGSCYGGAVINKSAAEIEKEMENANQSIIDAFAAADEEIAWMEDDTGTDGATAKVGEMCVSNKFFVITAARKIETGWINSRKGAFLLQWMEDAIYGADTNGDRAITMKELGKYLASRGRATNIVDAQGVVHHMIPQVYPAASSYAIFK